MVAHLVSRGLNAASVTKPQLLRWQEPPHQGSASHCPQLLSTQVLSFSCPIPPMNWYLEGEARGMAGKQLWVWTGFLSPK